MEDTPRDFYVGTSSVTHHTATLSLSLLIRNSYTEGGTISLLLVVLTVTRIIAVENHDPVDNILWAGGDSLPKVSDGIFPLKGEISIHP